MFISTLLTATNSGSLDGGNLVENYQCNHYYDGKRVGNLPIAKFVFEYRTKSRVTIPVATELTLVQNLCRS